MWGSVGLGGGMTIWNSGHVNRWHNNPHHALRNSQDTVWQHSARCAYLLWHIWPDIDRDTLIAALMHDAPEHVTGDTPWDVEKSDPQINAEDKFNADHGIPASKDARIKLVDKLDAYLWARSVDEWIVYAPEWREQINTVMNLADDLGVTDKVEELLNE